jgi:hypothetical protein
MRYYENIGIGEIILVCQISTGGIIYLEYLLLLAVGFLKAELR